MARQGQKDGKIARTGGLQGQKDGKDGKIARTKDGSTARTEGWKDRKDGRTKGRKDGRKVDRPAYVSNRNVTSRTCI